MQAVPAARAAVTSRSSRGIIACASERSRPSRCMAPPSAQKSFWRSTSSTAACRGSTLSERVLSMATLRCSWFPEHGLEIERLGELLLHRDVEIGLQAWDVELGGVFRQVHPGDQVLAEAGIFRDPVVALVL